MAYTSGTATNHYTLLTALKTFVTANGWTVLNFTDDSGATTNGRGSVLNLQGPGNGSGAYVFVNISTVNNSSTPSNGWQISGALGYASATEWGLQDSESPQPFFNIWNSSMNYWFFVDNRRIIVVAQVSTTFVSMYAGFFLPWANPAQYPFPLYIAGDYWEAANWSVGNTGRRFFVDCGGELGEQSGGWVRDPNGIWCPIINEVQTGSAQDQANNVNAAGLFALVWPWSAGCINGSGNGNTAWNAASNGQSFGGGLDLLVPTAQGERFVWPTQILYGSGPPLGTLDGVYATFGSGISSESVIAAGGNSYLAFQNIARTSGNDFLLIQEA